MSRVNMNLDIDMSNEGQLTAVSNFFKDLAKSAPSTKEQELDRLRKELEIHNRWFGEQAGTQSIPKTLEVLEKEPGKPSASQTTKEMEEQPSQDPKDESPSSEETGKSTATSKKRASSKSKTPTKSEKDTESSTKSKGTPSGDDEPEKPSKQGSDKPSKTDSPEDLKGPLRVLLAEKVDDHRAVIKAELGKYDAKGISNLAVEHHAAFMDFMKGLK